MGDLAVDGAVEIGSVPPTSDRPECLSCGVSFSDYGRCVRSGGGDSGRCIALTPMIHLRAPAPLLEPHALFEELRHLLAPPPRGLDRQRDEPYLPPPPRFLPRLRRRMYILVYIYIFIYVIFSKSSKHITASAFNQEYSRSIGEGSPNGPQILWH
jgi:hypothetical protein